jgi:hypothetical protein
MWPKVPEVLNNHATIPIIVGAIIVTTVAFGLIGKWFLRNTGLNQDD